MFAIFITVCMHLNDFFHAFNDEGIFIILIIHLLIVIVSRGKTGDHHCLCVAAKGVLEKSSELAVPEVF